MYVCTYISYKLIKSLRISKLQTVTRISSTCLHACQPACQVNLKSFIQINGHVSCSQGGWRLAQSVCESTNCLNTTNLFVWNVYSTSWQIITLSAAILLSPHAGIFLVGQKRYFAPQKWFCSPKLYLNDKIDHKI